MGVSQCECLRRKKPCGEPKIWALGSRRMSITCSDDSLGGTADGTSWSTVGTLNMGSWAKSGELLALDIASDVPSTPPSHEITSGAGHTGGVLKYAILIPTYAFNIPCNDVLRRHLV